jgi:molybdopterin converting factor small subunit
MDPTGRPPEGTLRIRLRYLSALRDRTGLREETVPLPEGSGLQELAVWLARERALKLPDPAVMATLNGRGWGQYAEGLNTKLREGDEVALFPVVGGG